jgi:transcriptional regulator
MNIADAVSKGRNPKGEQHGNAKLTDENVKVIRQLREEGWRHWQIARHLGISRSAITAVLAGRAWKHVK